MDQLEATAYTKHLATKLLFPSADQCGDLLSLCEVQQALIRNVVPFLVHHLKETVAQRIISGSQ